MMRRGPAPRGYAPAMGNCVGYYCVRLVLTLIGMILYIMAMSYMGTADVCIYCRQTVVRPSSTLSFWLHLLAIPKILAVGTFNASQFLGDWFHGVYVDEARPGGGFGGAAMVPGGAYAMSREGEGCWPCSDPSSWNQYNYGYNTHKQSGWLSNFTDYPGC